MDTTQVSKMYQTLESIRHQNGDEYWYARDLLSLLGYGIKAEEFSSAI